MKQALRDLRQAALDGSEIVFQCAVNFIKLIELALRIFLKSV